MTHSEKPQNRGSLTMRIVLFTLVLLCGIAGTTDAQEVVKGTFALDAEARIGSTVLPAGNRK